MLVKGNGQEWKEERKGREGKVREVEGERGANGDRQRLGPTYNREHERAQNVPQWGTGDGRNRRHHALEPRQPTLTTAIHTYRRLTHQPAALYTFTSDWHSGTQSAASPQWIWLTVLKPNFINISPLLWVWVPLCDDSVPQHSDCSLHLDYSRVYIMHLTPATFLRWIYITSQCI